MSIGNQYIIGITYITNVIQRDTINIECKETFRMFGLPEYGADIRPNKLYF